MKNKSSVFLMLMFLLWGGGVTFVLLHAELPSRIESASDVFSNQEKTSIALPEAPKPNEQKPEELPKPVDPLDSLAPESFSNNMADLGFGAAYGQGGGPGIAGGHGLGGDQAQMVKDGGSSSKAPRLLSRSTLDYPQDAKAKGLRGHVSVRLLINQNGEVEDAKITESTPPGVFDQSVLSSVKRWRFEPGLAKGQVASMWIGQKVKFELE